MRPARCPASGRGSPPARAACSTARSSSSPARAASGSRRSRPRSAWPPPAAGCARSSPRSPRRDDVSRALGAATRRPRGRAGARPAPHLDRPAGRAWRSTCIDQLPSRALADVLVTSRAFAYFAAATPGHARAADDRQGLGARPGRAPHPGRAPYDLVVLDAPATGHGVAILARARGRSPRPRASGRSPARAARSTRCSSDPAQTGVVAVARPEEMPVNETLALQRRAARRSRARARPGRRQRRAARPLHAADARRSARHAPPAPAGARRAGRPRAGPRPARAARAAAPRRPGRRASGSSRCRSCRRRCSTRPAIEPLVRALERVL